MLFVYSMYLALLAFLLPYGVMAVTPKSMSSFTSGAGGVRVIGVSASRTGHAVNMIGDYNNDGRQDFAVSASNFTVGIKHGCGLVVIVLGQTGSWTEIDLSSATSGLTMRRVIGGSNNDNVGTAVGAAGDVNQDGYDDVLIGAGGVDLPSDTNVKNVGAIYVLFGMASTNPYTDIDLGNFATSASTGYAIYGPSESTFLGNGLLSIRPMGDLNGDSIDDFAISAPNALTNTGLVWFIYGYTAAPVDLYLSSFGSAGVLLTGAGAGYYFGTAIDNVGDFDGDGRDDVVIGAYGYNAFRGFAYLLYGSGSPISLDMSTFVTGNAGIRFLGAATGEEAGSSVSGAGDINGDGKMDLLIGAPAADPPSRSNAGKVYAIFGRSAKLSADFTLSTLVAGTEGLTILGVASNNYLGWTVSRGGDLDQDGFDDYLLGAYNGLGRVYVLYGSLTTPSANIDLSTYAGKIAAFNGGTSALLGYSLSGGVDVTGDGFPDILMGARNVAVTPAAGGSARVAAGAGYLMTGPVYPFTEAPTKDPTRSPTAAPSDPSMSPTAVPTEVPSVGPSRSLSARPSVVPSRNPSVRPSVVPSVTPSKTPSAKPSAVPSTGPSKTPSAKPSAVASIVTAAVPSAKPSAVPSTGPSKIPSVKPSAIPSTVTAAVPSAKPSAVPSTGPSKTPSAKPSAVPSTVTAAAPSAKPSVVPSVTPSGKPSVIPSNGPSLIPSTAPSAVFPSVPSVKPSVVPSTVPTRTPSVKPSAVSSVVPSRAPSLSPSVVPSIVPSRVPSTKPSVGLTASPTLMPTDNTTESPTLSPTASPSVDPTFAPSEVPSENPTVEPTNDPTQDSTVAPSVFPTALPSAVPTFAPSPDPTVGPSVNPTAAPTRAPSAKPSLVPTTQPTAGPTNKPYTVLLGVQQDVYFINKADYDSQKVRCNLTIQHTVAASMDGVLPERVTDIVVEEAESARVGNMRALATVAPPVSLKYKVTVNDPVLSAEVLTAQLKAKVQSGDMDNAFRAFAVMFNATKMQNGTFTEPKVTLLNQSHDETDFPSVGFIVGVTAGGLLFVCILVLFVCAYRRRNKTRNSVAVTNH